MITYLLHHKFLLCNIIPAENLQRNCGSLPNLGFIIEMDPALMNSIHGAPERGKEHYVMGPSKKIPQITLCCNRNGSITI